MVRYAAQHGVKTIGVTLSKQLCQKPIAQDAWRYDEVKPHWEKLMLRSRTDGALYQVYGAPGEVTDIALEAGEQLVGPGPVAAMRKANMLSGVSSIPLMPNSGTMTRPMAPAV